MHHASQTLRVQQDLRSHPAWPITCRQAPWPPATPEQLAAAARAARLTARGEAGRLFANPVTEDIAPGYLAEIARPMDLGSLERGLKRGDYATLGALCCPALARFAACFGCALAMQLRKVG